MKRALVTGGAGFIGSHLVDRLVALGWAVRVVDNLSSGRIENLKHVGSKDFEFVHGDLKDRYMAEKAVEGIDIVFHFAANPEVRVSTTDPEVHYRENVEATFNLLEAMRKKDVKELVFASSSSVYGEPEEIPVGEEAPTRPVSVYGATKAACEDLIHAYAKLYGIRAVVLRYANVVGPRLRHGVIYDLLTKLRRNPTTLEVLGDGTQTRSYVYIDDAVEATILAYEKANGVFEVYNVASEDWITVNDVVQAVLEATGLKPRVVYRPVLHGVGWPGDVKKIALKIDRLRTLGYKPKMKSIEAVRTTAKALIDELGVR